MLTARQLMLAIILLGAAASSTVAQGVAWTTDLAQAKQTARDSNKLLLLHFWSETCGPCRRLESTVFNQQNVAVAVAQKFVPVKLNASQHGALARELNITRVPTEVVMTPDGRVLGKAISPNTPMAYISKLGEMARRHTTDGGSGFAAAAAASPYGPVVNKNYADITASLPPAIPTQTAFPTQTANSISAGSATKASPQLEPNKSGQVQQVSRTAPLSQTNPYALAAAKAAGEDAAATKAAASQVSAGSDAKPQLPAGTPPLGFDGYCPVTMKEQWKWIQGDPRFGVIHRGQTFLFAGEKEKNTFFSNPDAYAPVLSGLDPVLALDEGKQSPGQRRFALEYEGQFFLFSSENTLDKFWSNSDRYARGVRQAMASENANSVR